MQLKICKNCSQKIIPNKELFTQNPYLQSNFNKKIFCNNNCRNNFYNKLKIKKYVLISTEHNQFVEDINKLIKGKIWFHNQKGYNPDITKDDNYYEVELFRRINHLNNKVKKWDKTKRHILILCISKLVMNIFNEVFFYDGTKLKRLKPLSNNRRF